MEAFERKKYVAVFSVVALGACAGSSGAPRAGAVPDSNKNAAAWKADRIEGPNEHPCKVGDAHPEARIVSLRDALREPDAYAGRLVKVRGYFVLEFENVSLVEPETRKESMVVGTKWLNVKNFAEAQACHLKLVDVEGYLARIPARGGERVLLQAYSMYGQP